MHLTRSAFWFLCFGIAPGLGCTEYEVEMAVLALEESLLPWDVPEVVEPGESFQVGFLTWGGGCISPYHDEIEPIPSGVRITPYDRRATNRTCTLDLQTDSRRVELVFEEPGEHRIVVRGRSDVTSPPEDILSVEYVVVVGE